MGEKNKVEYLYGHPPQCLAKHEARAIDDYQNQACTLAPLISELVSLLFFFLKPRRTLTEGNSEVNSGVKQQSFM